MDVTLYRLSIPFAIVTGCMAGLLAAVAWDILRDSPFGSALKLLAVVMSTATVYHVGLLVFGSETLPLQLLLILGYILILVALFAAVWEFNSVIWSESTLRHHNVLFATVLGILLYAVGGLLTELFVPSMLHWVHGFAALFAIAGLYSPIHDDLRKEPWSELLLNDATDGRQHAEWMRPIDDAILELLYSSKLILTPAVIAYNIDYSRDEVNRRLTKLETKELVERIERGKYGLSEKGERYIEG